MVGLSRSSFNYYVELSYDGIGITSSQMAGRSGSSFSLTPGNQEALEEQLRVAKSQATPKRSATLASAVRSSVASKRSRVASDTSDSSAASVSAQRSRARSGVPKYIDDAAAPPVL
ncbi:uncharacterized protein TRUGW13939_05398 [Talaromyces rugulosus]|uniref:Uncharacterized protein n=1 Tax=Talaromyces rugulosus TaxID=121627 RepID=A0A7H8QWW1_TALRU|nr:uncharacterized protein TRUGW13939_05398 [Talaromyces rugulosus]QKX58276.1 hypothetical protein TRUGW13939_05398 [Talaromyces rugulosus]